MKTFTKNNKWCFKKGSAHPFFGKHFTAQHKARIGAKSREWHAKNKLSIEAIEKIRQASLGRIPWNKGLTKETDARVVQYAVSGGRARMGKSQPWNQGENHPNWKGGTTLERVRVWGTAVYRSWREAVFARDAYTCVQCGSKNGDGNGKTVKLNADHIKPWVYFPELRFEISNGRTLCVPCHRKTPTFGKRVHALQSS